MSGPVQKFTQEFKDELGKEVISTSKPIKDVAISYGVRPDTLRAWLVKYRAANEGSQTDLNISERERYMQLERENRALRAETAFLKKRAPTSPRNSDSRQI